MGVSTHAWWCAAGDTVLVVADDQAVRLPNSVVVGPGFSLVAGSVSPGDHIVVGRGAVTTRTADWRIGRWWDPRVVPIDADQRDVIRLVRAAAASVSPSGGEPLITALLAGDHHCFVELADRFIGRGEGLTPEGDDFLTGIIAGYHHGCASLGDPTGAAVLEQVRLPVLATARESTTLLSCSLLRHAFVGEVAAPMGALLRALTGRGDLATALAATDAIGHRSGPALASGVVAGIAAGCGVRL
jgi:hypothetical protein